MDIRNGKCFDCGAEYKIPASFPHDVARCKECGQAVHIAKVGEPMPTRAPSAAPKPAPAKKVAHRESSQKGTSRASSGAPSKAGASPKLEEYIPSGKKKEGPSMMERLRAERAAAAAKGATGTAHRPTPKTTKSAGTARAVKPSAASARKPAVPQKKTATKGASKSSRTRGAAGRSGARAAGSARRTGKDAGDGRKRPERGTRQKEKKSPVMGIIALVVLLGGAAVFLMKDKLFGSGDSVVAGETTEQASTQGDASMATMDDEAGEEADLDNATDDEAMPEDPAASEAEGASEGDNSSEPQTAPADEASDTPPLPVDEGPDTALLPDIPPMFGATPEEMAEMETHMAKWMDPYAGAAGNRSRDKLINNYGLKALSVMVNAMKDLDLSTPEGNSNGDQIQKALQKMFFEKNFGWKYPSSEPDKYLAYNRKAVSSWHTQIQKIADEGIEYFIAMTQIEKKDPETGEYKRPERAKKAAELRMQYGAGSSAPPAGVSNEDDDLDVD